MDPCIDEFGSRAPLLDVVLKEQQRWEQMPQRREPLTKSMVKAQHELLSVHDLGFFTLEAAMSDWLSLGIHTGARRIEWAQTSSSVSKIERDISGLPRAFIMQDFKFYGPRRRQLSLSPSTVLDKAASVDITWRTQKNGDNGQYIMYTVNNSDYDLCPVRSALRMRRRAQLLGVPAQFPLAVYRQGSNNMALIHSDHIRSTLQSLARHCYDITDKDDLSRYTSHSIRVGACVALHIANKSTDFIQAALRWRSDAFKMYLRNVVELAEQRIVALNAHDPDGMADAHVASI